MQKFRPYLKSIILLFVLIIGLPVLAFTQEQVSDKIRDLAFVLVPVGVIIGAFIISDKIKKNKK